MSGVIFDLAPVRDIAVRKGRAGAWTISCADCWAFGVAPTWASALALANAHAAEDHREVTPCP